MTGNIWGRVQFIMSPRISKQFRLWKPEEGEGIKKKKTALLPGGQLSVCCLQAAATHSLQLK